MLLEAGARVRFLPPVTPQADPSSSVSVSVLIMEEHHESESVEPSEPQPLAHRNTNFFIDNILRPDFGCRKQRRAARSRSPEPENFNDSVSSSSSSSSSSISSSSSSSSPSVSSPPLKSGGEGVAGAGRQPLLWPAWVYCTRYSDRPSSGPRTRKLKRKKVESSADDKRPRTAFSAEQLQRLRSEFQLNRYITEQRRQTLALQLNLNEAQIKIWFQNKRAKIKKASGVKNTLALQLMAQGLYNHSTTTVPEDNSE